jgi:uncharacterized membrane protein
VASTQKAIINRQSQATSDLFGNRELQAIPEIESVSSSKNISAAERTMSVIGGVTLAVFGTTRRSLVGGLLATAGGLMIYRGAIGHSRLYDLLGIKATESEGASGVYVEKTMTINKSPEELYKFWRNFEILPCFMNHLESVRFIDDKHSHWIAKAPAGRTVEWDAEIIAERENELIAWRSLDNADITNEGFVSFMKAPGDRGTEVKIVLKYEPPAGVLGVIIAKIFGEEPANQIKDDLRHIKQMMEAGEVPTTEGQPSGRE